MSDKEWRIIDHHNAPDLALTADNNTWYLSSTGGKEGPVLNILLLINSFTSYRTLGFEWSFSFYI